MRQKHIATPDRATPQGPVTGPLAALLPLRIQECSHADKTQRPVFDALLHGNHYLGHRSSVGENLQYLVCDGAARPLACVLFGAAAWQCAARDGYLGWASRVRARNLQFIANNTRFLILPWVQVPTLASYLLSRIAQRISGDWQAKYGHALYLLETFVQSDRFAGTIYRAANWVRVGQTKGRTRQDQPDGTWYQTSIKDIYLYPLHRGFRQCLQGQLPQPS